MNASVTASETGSSVVLVVEDEAPVRRLERSILERAGYQVHESEHGLAALELLETGLEPAVAVVDLVMPFMDGRTFLVEVSKRGFRFSVVLASASPEASAVVEELGVTEHLPKPFEARELVHAVARALGTA